MNKYPFLIRLLIGIPALALAFPLWCILLLWDPQGLGRAMKKTGENLLDHYKIKEDQNGRQVD